MNVLPACVCVCVSHVWKSGEGIGFPGTAVSGGCEPLHGCRSSTRAQVLLNRCAAANWVII